MPCPNCDATMQNLGTDDAPRKTFWCPNCGTLKFISRALDVPDEIETPRVTSRLNAGRGGKEFVQWEDEYFRRRNQISPLPIPPEELL